MRDSWISKAAATGDLDESGLGGRKGLNPNWSRMRSDIRQGNGMKPGFLKDGGFFKMGRTRADKTVTENGVVGLC